MIRLYKRIAVIFFGGFEKTETFKKLGKDIRASGASMILKTYVSMIILTTILSYIFSLVSVYVLLTIMAVNPLSSLLFIVTIPTFCAFSVFTIMYFYPSQRAKSVKKNIENDLPFAITHMSAISSSGIPPEFMFELLTGFKEYREVSNHAKTIVRNIKTFGMSSVTALKSVAKSTPSPAFKQILNGIAFNIEKGGNISKYLKEMSDKSLFEYRIKREKYLKTLSTYADIYTALLVAAPLMMLAVLAILGIIGGEIVGLSMNELILVLTFGVLPSLNIAFIAFIHLTHPGS